MEIRGVFKVYNKSCHQMTEIIDNSVQLIVTSPPYPMIKKWNDTFNGTTFEEQHRELFVVWEECYRILSDGGIMCVNIGDATRRHNDVYQAFPNAAKIMINCMDIGFYNFVPILWKKISNRPNAFLGSGMLPTNSYVSQDHEYILIFRKGGPRKFKPKDPNRYDSAFSKEQRNVWFNQVWNIGSSKNGKEFSAFPQELPDRLIQMFSVKSDIVVDPFAGTNITGNSAYELNRNYIGYEINNFIVDKFVDTNNFEVMR